MEFFDSMSKLIDGYTVTLTIRNEKDKMIVLLIPNLTEKKEEVQKLLTPLTITGTPEELDQQFFALVAQGLRKAEGIQTNITEHEASLKKAEDKTVKNKTGDIAAKKPVEKSAQIFDEKKETPEEKKEKASVKEPVGEKQTRSIKPGKTSAKEPKAKNEPVTEKEAAAGMTEPINEAAAKSAAVNQSSIAPGPDLKKESLPANENDGFSDEDW